MIDAELRTARLLAGADSDHSGQLAEWGPIPDVEQRQLVQMITDSGLTGRGGAGFPTGRKLAAVAAGGGAVVVGNGAEGEPASSKDRVLLTRAPHLVLDGLFLAARAVDATKVFLYAPADLLDTVLAAALRQRGDGPSITTVASEDRFISGQESAVVAAVEGKRALPRGAAAPVFARGVGGRPTLVQNVETLAQVAMIARRGAHWFRSAGTAEEPGSRLVTVSGAVAMPGVFEVNGGERLGAAIAAAGGISEDVQAVLVGGYHGGWVPWSADAEALPMTRAALAPYGAAPGAGVVIALPARTCGLRAAAQVANYLADQNAGQCGPCRNGLPALAGNLAALAVHRATPDIRAVMDSLARQVDGRGACAHPNGTVRLVRSSVRTFAAEVDRHLRRECSEGFVAPDTTGPERTTKGRAR